MSAAIEPMSRNEIDRLYARYGLPVIGGGEQTAEELAAAEAAAAEAKAKAEEEAKELAAAGINTDAGKEALRKEREARRAAEKAAKEALDRAAALEAKQQEADAAKAKADEDEAARKGEFEKLANERAESLKAVTGERDSYKGQLDALITAITPDVNAAWKEIPDEIKSFYDGGDDDVLAKRAFLAKSKPALDKFTAQQHEANDRFRKVPTTPKPNGNGLTGDDDKARKNQARMVSTI